jgi:hypothetical protein
LPELIASVVPSDLSGGRCSSVVVGKIEHAGIGIGGRERFAEQARQQAVEVLFRSDCHVDVEKAADRALHAVHG